MTLLTSYLSSHITNSEVEIKLKNNVYLKGIITQINPKNLNILLENVSVCTNTTASYDVLLPHAMNSKQLFIRGSTIVYININPNKENNIQSSLQAMETQCKEYFEKNT